MRDPRIDILRFIGLSMIILAHVNPPSIIFQLRNFDVPLMVLISGMAYSLTATKIDSYIKYVWKRVKRLVFPVWIFLTFYFLAHALFKPDSPILDLETIYESYFLINGIGYVWIIRVFVLVALIAPFILFINQKVNSEKIYFTMIIMIFLIYEIIRYFTLPFINNFWSIAISHVLFYLVPYSIMFAVGIRVVNTEKRTLRILIGVNLFIFISIAIFMLIESSQFVPTQNFKYPPSIYYFSYALFVSLVLWYYSNNIAGYFETKKYNPIVVFISTNSIWIYLWHIPCLKVIHTNFIMKYFAVFIVATLITYVQVYFINIFSSKFIKKQKLRSTLKILFTG